MDYSRQPGPFVPVIRPYGFEREDDVVPLFGQTAEEELVRKRDELFAQRAAERASDEERKRFLIFGLSGVLIGAAVTGGMTALSLRSYRRTDSVVGPAIYTAIGSAAMGGAMVLILSRAMSGKKVDTRVAALAIGARMAA